MTSVILLAVVAEWLRCWTWKPMGFPRAGSNPAGCEDQVFKGEYLKPDNIITYCYSPIIEIQIQYLLRVWLHKLASSSIISSYLHPQFLKAQFCFEMTRESRCSSSTEKRPWCLEVACGCQLVQLVMLPSLSWWYAFEKRHSNGHLKFCNLTKSVQIFLFSKPAAAEKEENKNHLPVP